MTPINQVRQALDEIARLPTSYNIGTSSDYTIGVMEGHKRAVGLATVALAALAGIEQDRNVLTDALHRMFVCSGPEQMLRVANDALAAVWHPPPAPPESEEEQS